jgi:hypothetical protein
MLADGHRKCNKETMVEIISRTASGQISHGDDDKPFGENSDRKHTVCFTVKISGNIS